VLAAWSLGPKKAAGASAFGYKPPIHREELLAVSKPPPQHKHTNECQEAKQNKSCSVRPKAER